MFHNLTQWHVRSKEISCIFSGFCPNKTKGQPGRLWREVEGRESDSVQNLNSEQDVGWTSDRTQCEQGNERF